MLKRIMLFAIIAITLTPIQSCKLFQPIQIVSPYNASLVSEINAFGVQADMIYSTMLYAADKSIDAHKEDYVALQVSANSIVAIIEAMPKSGLMLKQAILVQDMVKARMESHRLKGRLNESEIAVNMDYFRRQLKPLRVSAMALK